MTITTNVRTASTKIYLEPGDATTCLAGAAILAGHFVKVTTGGLGNHPKVVHADAKGPAYGVAHFAADDKTDVSVLRAGTVGVVTGEAITSGQEVQVGAAGVAMVLVADTQAGLTPFAVTKGGRAVGVATADIDNGAIGPVTLY